MKDFRNLKVWQKAHELTLDCYRCTKKFPSDERYGLTSQIRRASASVAANIAEGYGRRSDAEFNRFLQISAGSSNELAYHLILAHDLAYLPKPEHDELQEKLDVLQKMLSGLMSKLDADRSNSP